MPLTDTDIRLLHDVTEARECAELMASMDPWRTLGRTVEAGVQVLTDSSREVYVVRDARGLAAFIVLDLHGLLRGYIQTVCVAPNRQGQGLGSFLVGWAEQRIGRESPNVFLCVSSFNPGARRLYERLGYEFVGNLSNFFMAGYDELLFRKTRGPWVGFKAP